MLCRVCCTRGEKAGKTTQPCPTCAAACRDTAFTSLGQHWALDQFCTGWNISSAKDFSISQFWTTRGFSENPELLEQLKNKKCHFLDPSLWGGKALVPLFDSRAPVLLHRVNNQWHTMHFHCQGLILCSHISSGSAVGSSFCLTWVAITADQVGGSQPLMMTQQTVFPVLVELIFAAHAEWH